MVELVLAGAMASVAFWPAVNVSVPAQEKSVAAPR
jgi:hypothetical protein